MRRMDANVLDLMLIPRPRRRGTRLCELQDNPISQWAKNGSLYSVFIPWTVVRKDNSSMYLSRCHCKVDGSHNNPFYAETNHTIIEEAGRPQCVHIKCSFNVHEPLYQVDDRGRFVVAILLKQI
jgi:hypothetical protein